MNSIMKAIGIIIVCYGCGCSCDNDNEGEEEEKKRYKPLSKPPNIKKNKPRLFKVLEPVVQCPADDPARLQPPPDHPWFAIYPIRLQPIPVVL